MTEILDAARIANTALSWIAFFLILSRYRETHAFARKRTARYFGYLGLVFYAAVGNTESALQGAPTGFRTALGFFVLIFIVYSEWEHPKK